MPILNPPDTVLDIAARLEEAGFEAWCVGGAIRDALLGHPHLDWDLATSATPDDVRELFGKRRTIPVGVEFGTVGVLDRDGRMHEVTTFRRDVKTDGRHAVVEFGVSLDDDLARRDFTINAIAYSPKRDEIRDPFGGRDDLARRLVRAVGDAEARMREDRLRALRAIRFASRFEFDIEPATRAAIANSAPFLGRLSAERVKQELEKTMQQVRRAGAALRIWRDTGALAVLIPALGEVSDVTLGALDLLPKPGPSNRPRRALDRLTMLFADVSQRELGTVMTDLRFSRHEMSWISGTLERLHRVESPILDALTTGAPSDAQVRQWVGAMGRLHVPAVMRLAMARWCAAGRVPATVSASAVHSLHGRMLDVAFRDPVEMKDLAVNGNDLRRAGIPAGPKLGEILQALLDWVLEDPARNEPARLVERALTTWNSMGRGED